MFTYLKKQINAILINQTISNVFLAVMFLSLSSSYLMEPLRTIARIAMLLPFVGFNCMFIVFILKPLIKYNKSIRFYTEKLKSCEVDEFECKNSGEKVIDRIVYIVVEFKINGEYFEENVPKSSIKYCEDRCYTKPVLINNKFVDFEVYMDNHTITKEEEEMYNDSTLFYDKIRKINEDIKQEQYLGKDPKTIREEMLKKIKDL